jgi:hypothetical protein
MDKPKLGEAETLRTRLPYEPPAVISEEVFETLALSCLRADEFLCSPAVQRS